MTTTGFAPFDAGSLAERSEFSLKTGAGAGAPKPFDHPAVVDERGAVWLPVPGSSAAAVGYTLHPGVSLRWGPAPELGGAILELTAGWLDRDGSDGIAVLLTATGLRNLAADLAAIADELGGTR